VNDLNCVRNGPKSNYLTTSTTPFCFLLTLLEPAYTEERLFAWAHEGKTFPLEGERRKGKRQEAMEIISAIHLTHLPGVK